MTFYWEPLGKQIRIEGAVEKTSAEESDAYFALRPRESQIGAWASQQSQTLASRAKLEADFREFEIKFAGDAVPRPPFWSGYQLQPTRFEFWDKRDHRLHDRQNYQKDGDDWQYELLYP